MNSPRGTPFGVSHRGEPRGRRHGRCRRRTSTTARHTPRPLSAARARSHRWLCRAPRSCRAPPVDGCDGAGVVEPERVTVPKAPVADRYLQPPFKGDMNGVATETSKAEVGHRLSTSGTRPASAIFSQRRWQSRHSVIRFSFALRFSG